MLAAFIAAFALMGQTPDTPSHHVEEVLRSHDGFSGVAFVFNAQEIETVYATDPAMAVEDWRWASVSKLINAVAIHQAVDDGVLRLDQEVNDFVEEPHHPGLTIRDLLQHTSGLANLDYPRLGQIPYVSDPFEYCRGRPRSAPGESFEYNNCDTVVAASVLAAARGQDYQTILEERIFAPAQMRDVRAGTGSDKGAFGGGPSLHVFGASANLVGPGQSLVRFAQALLRGELVSEASMEELRAGNPRLGYVSAGAWSFPANLSGCEGAVSVIERHGHISPVQVRIVLAPDLGRGVVAFTDNDGEDFGEVWRGQGLSFELLSAAFCTH